MKVPTLEKLLEDQLKDIYSAENQLSKVLPKMAKAASAEGLKEAFTSHLEETRAQIERLNEIGQILEIRLTGKKCAAMEGLIEEGKEALELEGPPAILDLALIAAAQRIEHYEISAYGTAKAIAGHLGHEDVVALLQETEDEESAADEKLTEITTNEVLAGLSEESDEDEDVSEDQEDEDGEEEEERPPAPNKKAPMNKKAMPVKPMAKAKR